MIDVAATRDPCWVSQAEHDATVRTVLRHAVRAKLDVGAVGTLCSQLGLSLDATLKRGARVGLAP